MSGGRPLLARLIAIAGCLFATAPAAPVEFNLPAQPATDALIAFSQQGHVEVLFAYDDLRTITTNAVVGSHEPEDALVRLLKGTGFAARRKSPGRFVVAAAARPTGTLRGRVVDESHRPIANITVALPGTSLTTTRASPRTELTSVDLPTFGRPTMATRISLGFSSENGGASTRFTTSSSSSPTPVPCSEETGWTASKPN